MKTKIESFRDVWKFPLRLDENSAIYAWSDNGVMALTFAVDRPMIIKAIIACINGQNVEITGKWERSGTNFYCDGNLAFMVRGWGHLVGGGALRLPMKEAARIQDEFCDFIWRQLTTPLDEKSHEELIRCPKCGHVQRARVQHTLPFHTYIHTCESCLYTILESEWEVV